MALCLLLGLAGCKHTLATHTQSQDLAAERTSAEAAEAALSGIARDFRRHYSVLYQLMQSSRLQSSRRAPALRQLILRLNFNHFSERLTVSHMLGAAGGGGGDAGGGAQQVAVGALPP